MVVLDVHGLIYDWSFSRSFAFLVSLMKYGMVYFGQLLGKLLFFLLLFFFFFFFFCKLAKEYHWSEPNWMMLAFLSTFRLTDLQPFHSSCVSWTLVVHFCFWLPEHLKGVLRSVLFLPLWHVLFFLVVNRSAPTTLAASWGPSRRLVHNIHRRLVRLLLTF